MVPIRVVIVDDHPIVRQGISHMLAYRPDIQVVGEAGSAAEFYLRLDECHPDLVLLDIRLPDQSGIEIAQRLHRERPDVRTIILTASDDDEFVFEALRAGAHGYLLKSSSPNFVTEAILRVARGERLLSPNLVDRVLRGFQELAQSQARGDLNDEQVRILRMIADGATNRAIAQALFVSEVTAKRKVQEILDIMGAANRAQAAAEAARRGLV